MKKYIAIILICLITLTGAYFWFRPLLPTKGLNHLAIVGESPTTVVLTTENEELMTQYVDVLNNCKSINKPINFDPQYTIEVGYTKHDPITLKLDFNLDSQEIIFNNINKEGFYKIDETASLELFISSYFTEIYPYSEQAEIDLAYDVNQLSPSSIETEWNFQLINGDWGENNTGQKELDQEQFVLTDIQIPFKINYTVKPITSTLKVMDQDVVLYESTIEDGEFYPYEKEGTFTYLIESQWNANEYNGSQSVAYNVTVNLPVKFTLSKPWATAGDFFVIYAENVDSDETIHLDQKLVSWTPGFFDDNNKKMAFIPLNYWAKKGKYKISLHTSKNDEVQENSKKTFDVQIRNKNFPKQYLYIDESVEKSTRNPEAYTQYNKHFKPARDVVTTEKLWEGPFIKPVDGRISTEFGEMRYVNDALTSYRHSGTDYAVPKGTPVKAPNNGRVNLSMFLTLTGNTIVIDHGMGLFSVYFHLDSLNVEKGQMVTKGDVIGAVGSTGFSTGPHLHYTTSIGKTNFDSLLLTDYDPSVQ